MIALRVVYEFATYKRGDLITDAQAIAEITESDNAGKVVRVNAPDA